MIVVSASVMNCSLQQYAGEDLMYVAVVKPAVNVRALADAREAAPLRRSLAHISGHQTIDMLSGPNHCPVGLS